MVSRANLRLPTLHSFIFPQIKGSTDPETGKITGEFGVHVPILGYQSIKPFAGSFKDGIGEKINVLGTQGGFLLKEDGNSLKVELDLPTGSYQMTLLRWGPPSKGETTSKDENTSKGETNSKDETTSKYEATGKGKY